MLKDKRYFMIKALALSKNALPVCRPNPPVACLLVKTLGHKSHIVAQGYTQSIGQDHAEVQAIKAYKNASPNQNVSLEDVTAYVTLEPCAFEGRTPSCAKMLGRSGIKNVVVAMLDPDPRNAGQGIKILEEAGIKVTLGVARTEVEAFLKPYLGQS